MNDYGIDAYTAHYGHMCRLCWERDAMTYVEAPYIFDSAFELQLHQIARHS